MAGSFVLSIYIPQLLLKGVAPLTSDNYWKYILSEDGFRFDDSMSFKVEDSITVINDREYFVIKAKNPISSGYRYCGIFKDSFYVQYDPPSQDSLYKYLKVGANVGDTLSQNWHITLLYFSVTDS